MAVSGANRLMDALKAYELWLFLAWQDIRLRYRRSKIGPFWITLSMGLFCVALGFVYGNLFKIEIKDYLPFISIGFVIWGMLSGMLGEFPNTYIDNAAYIKDIKVNPISILMRVVARHVIIFCHNLLIVVGIYLYFDINPGITVLVLAPALILILCNMIAIGIVLSLIGARFRDVPQIVQSIVQIIFFITPILWFPRLVPEGSWIILVNPFAYYLDLMRSPLLGQLPDINSWVVAFITALVFAGVAIFLFRRKASRIAFWV